MKFGDMSELYGRTTERFGLFAKLFSPVVLIIIIIASGYNLYQYDMCKKTKGGKDFETDKIVQNGYITSIVAIILGLLLVIWKIYRLFTKRRM